MQLTTGRFLKRLIRRAWATLWRSARRRRKCGLRMSLEGLESRDLLTSAAYDAPPVAAEIQIITIETSDPADQPAGLRIAKLNW